MFDVDNNEICPPYPRCIEYLGKQKTELCGESFCPDHYTEINGECYSALHLAVLQDLISNNDSLAGTDPLDIAENNGYQKWKNGKIEELVLNGNGLTKMPESICNIYEHLSVFDMSNNAICPPYPSCIAKIGYQNTKDCLSALSCPEGFVVFDDKCYHYGDLQVLIDFKSKSRH